MSFPSRPFQPCLTYVDKARSLPKSGALEDCFTHVGSGLPRKHWTMLERPAEDKHPNLSGQIVKFEDKNVL